MEVVLRVCTIIASNYWAHARVLARSVHQHHPGAELTVLVIDLDPLTERAAEREPFDVVGPDALGIDRRELMRMAGIYDVLELSTAIKPWLLRWLLASDPEPVIYLDPDIELFAPIDAVAGHARECGIVLTPHTIAPLPLDEYGPNELTILQSGTYNLGFIAVSDQAEAFLDWWAERLKRDCLISKEEGLFVDQRWIDLVPNYFDPYVLREPGWNVAYWNIPARELARSAQGYTVNGDPLRFFHYSGFDPNRPDRLSFYQGESPKVRLEDHPILAELCHNYAHKLIQAGHRSTFRSTYTYDRTPTGLRLDARARRIYRRALVKSEREGAAEPPNPFDTRRPDAFEDWLNEMTGPQEVTRYLRALYEEREDIRHAFPDIDGADARLFVDWVRETGAPHTGIPDRLVPRPLHPKEVAGVDISGYMSAENGVGEAARKVVKIFEMADVPHTVLSYRNTRSRQDVVVNDTDAALFDVKVLCVNADQTPTFAADSDTSWTDGYTVGVWAWEVEAFPSWMAEAESHVDEVWTYSEHAAHAIRDAITKPVFVLPPPIEMPRVRRKPRAALGLPEGFLFLFCFDFDSVFERKNPIAVVEAFRRAFPTPSGPQLVIKTVRGEGHPEEFARLSGAIAGRGDIHLVNGYLDAADHAAVVASCDAYVSLHRAEGFGFTIAEAMAFGKPVIATAYSGNLEFMDDTNAWLIPYRLVADPRRLRSVSGRVRSGPSRTSKRPPARSARSSPIPRPPRSAVRAPPPTSHGCTRCPRAFRSSRTGSKRSRRCASCGRSATMGTRGRGSSPSSTTSARDPTSSHRRGTASSVVSRDASSCGPSATSRSTRTGSIRRWPMSSVSFKRGSPPRRLWCESSRRKIREIESTGVARRDEDAASPSERRRSVR